MTDSLPGFTFDPKTGELSRGGRALTLSGRCAKLFAALSCEFIGTDALSVRTRIQYTHVGPQLGVLRRRIEGLGFAIESRRGYGYRLVVGAMPAKWTPEIPPPVTVDDVRKEHGETRRPRRGPFPSQRPWSEAELERGYRLRVDDDMEWDEIARELRRTSASVVRDKITREITRRHRQDSGSLRGLTPQQIAERDARRAGYDARDRNAVFFGDPPRGFSALDKQRGRA